MKITLVISVFILSIGGIIFTSCDDKLEVLQAYDFSVSTMPGQKRIKQGNYKEAKFYIGYFQPDGVDTLKMDDVQCPYPMTPTHSKRRPSGSTTPPIAPTNNKLTSTSGTTSSNGNFS